MKLYKYTAVFEPDDGALHAFVPALPELHTCGDTIEEARFMVQEALELVILSRLEEGESIPADKKIAKLPRGARSEAILVTVDHHVHTTPLTNDVKTAFA